MKRFSIGVAALALSLSFVGCSKDKVEESPKAQPLTAQLHSQCRDLEAQDCIGAFGFSVDESGHYVVGPGSAGERIEGNVTPKELALFREALNSAGALSTGLNNIANHEDNGVSDVVTVIRDGSAREAVVVTGSEIRYQTSTAEQGKALHSAIRSLAERYYPSSLSADCASAIQNILGLQDAVRSCQVDADCAYSSENYEVRRPDPGMFYDIYSDFGRFYRPQLVANASLLESRQEELRAADSRAWEACPGRARPDWSTFQTDGGEPLCVQKVCRVNPAISY